LGMGMTLSKCSHALGMKTLRRGKTKGLWLVIARKPKNLRHPLKQSNVKLPERVPCRPRENAAMASFHSTLSASGQSANGKWSAAVLRPLICRFTAEKRLCLAKCCSLSCSNTCACALPARLVSIPA